MADELERSRGRDRKRGRKGENCTLELEHSTLEPYSDVITRVVKLFVTSECFP